jgi:hypothetical protein
VPDQIADRRNSRDALEVPYEMEQTPLIWTMKTSSIYMGLIPSITRTRSNARKVRTVCEPSCAQCEY